MKDAYARTRHTIAVVEVPTTRRSYYRTYATQWPPGACVHVVLAPSQYYARREALTAHRRQCAVLPGPEVSQGEHAPEVQTDAVRHEGSSTVIPTAFHQELSQPVSDTLDEGPDLPGAWLACCEAWHLVTRVPFRCPYCHRGYLQESNAWLRAPVAR